MLPCAALFFSAVREVFISVTIAKNLPPKIPGCGSITLILNFHPNFHPNIWVLQIYPFTENQFMAT